jgi:ABC-type dipeptide/oligopeptide/nickel transport system ATPase component
MNRILCIVGESGAGKDTLATAIIDADTSNTVYKQYKFASPGKRVFERLYGLRLGFMDDREARVRICPGGETSYLQRFIFWFHNQHQIFPPGMFLNLALKEIITDINSVHTAIYTDLRTPHEANSLVKLCDKFNVELRPILIINPSSEPQTSDLHLDLNLSILSHSAKAQPTIMVMNFIDAPIEPTAKNLIKYL